MAPSCQMPLRHCAPALRPPPLPLRPLSNSFYECARFPPWRPRSFPARALFLQVIDSGVVNPSRLLLVRATQRVIQQTNELLGIGYVDKV